MMAKTTMKTTARKTAVQARSARRRPAKTVAVPELKTVIDHVRYAVSRLNAAGVVFAHGTSDPVAEAAFIVGEALHLHPDQFEMFSGAAVTGSESAAIAGLIEQRITTRKPAAYLLNKIYMRGLPFYVDERTIVPRSFIGELLESHFRGEEQSLIPDPLAITRALDLCTGSGCLAILMARTFPNAVIDAVDLSADALEVAKRNVADHDLEGRINLLKGDLFNAVGDASYDLIISNPPYVDAWGMENLPEECRHEPAMAFDGGEDGIDLVRRIVEEAPIHLKDGGGLLCEIGRCRPAVEEAYPNLPFLWLDTEESEGEVFWLEAGPI